MLLKLSQFSLKLCQNSRKVTPLKGLENISVSANITILKYSISTSLLRVPIY